MIGRRIAFATLSATAALAGTLVACTSADKPSGGAQAAGAASLARANDSSPSQFPSQPLTFSPSAATALRPFAERLLPNGLRLLFVEDPALPYVQYSALIRSGSAQDPKNLSGLANFTAELLDQGTVKRSAVQIADALGKLGSEFNAQAQEDYTMASVSSLSTNADALLDVFSEILMQPAFADAEIARARAQILARLQKRVDDPNGFANDAFADFLYGDHPYSRSELGATSGVAEIKKKNIILYYKRHFRPNNAILSVVGKITPELRERVEKTFGAWRPQELSPPTFPPAPPIDGLKIRLVEKPGLQQAQIRIGHVGIRRQDDDYLALRTANVILGGAFASRLMTQVRAKLGLTYSIHSQFDPRMAEGPFLISTFTKPPTIGKTVEESLKVFAEFRDKGVTADEVERARAYLKGIFPQAIETAEKFAQNLMVLRLYGVPDSYLSEYGRSLDKLSAADVNRAIAKRMNAKNLKILVYASAEALPQLKALGAVEEKSAAEILK